MKYTFIFVSLLLQLLWLPTAANAQIKNEAITWFIWDLPPEFVSDGPWKKQGYADRFLQYFIKNLPEYSHKIQTVNVPRWTREALKTNTCTAHLWNGFYTDKLAFSKPYTFTPPHVLIFHKRFEEKFGPRGTMLSLEELLKDPSLKLLIMKAKLKEDVGESRYPVLYPYLKPYLGTPRITELSIQNNFVHLKLLEKQRGDYTIGYPSTIISQKRVFDLTGEFVSYRIKEHNFYKKVHVACFGDAKGQEIISKINRLLTKKTLLEFITYHDEWNDQDPFFRETSVNYLIKGQNLPNVID